ncbi:tetratricopeptide repeat protein [Spirosoma validum]|uniref:Tetratricopeptide repeat protein n=1 Tax=Spirosoma validum TaxID=2771355 RepID=A0A927B4I8_9BACT|nr:tetratricopeptide repeat protein [Spirosoma validum]MBD2755163.1 tetratricopeptide repeat protein [Spirosoma validum]
MIPAETNRNVTVWPLADLFEALRREGFQLRPDDYLEIVQVLNTFQPQSHTDLQALIAPLLVVSDEEQEKFDRIFEQVWQQEGLKPHAVEPKPENVKPEGNIPWLWVAVALLSSLIAVYVAFLWPGPAFRSDIRLVSESTGPIEVGDTLVFGVDSSLRQAAGPRARWQWEMPDGKPYPRANEPELPVIAQRSGPLVVNLRSQRGTGLWLTTWTDSLRGVEHPICDKLPVIQIDSVRLKSPSGKASYRFRARIVQSSSAVQLTQWRFDGSVVAQNQTEWERTFSIGKTPVYHGISFEAIPDTSQRLCFGEAKLTVGILGTSEPPFTLDVRQTGKLIVPQTQLDRRYYWALWALGILIVLLIGYYLWMVVRDRMNKDSEKPESPDPDNPLARFTSDKPPLEIPLENRDADLITRDQSFYQLVRTLRQPTEGEIQRLHVSRTMQATMREGGFPTLVFQPHMMETEYLFLIDRSQIRSQQVALFDYLFRTFVQENVCVERFFFQKTFDLFTNEKQTKGLTLRQLANTYRQHTLIIWSNGYPLLYPPYPVVEPAIREALTDWESRAILTPIPFADWGSKERALQTDFLLLPADLTGQLRLIQALNEKQTYQNSYLSQQKDELYSTEYVEFQEIDELRDYLGDDLFQWLAAVAVYPRIRWEVVVEMGRALLPPEAVNFTNLLKLARISWMHEGSFPDYTRLELLKALRPENEAKARQTLLRMLTYAEQYFPGERFYDGEKYLLQTINQFTLYAHNADTFADYQPAQEAFKKLYEQGLFPDGAALRYLENPDNNWTTLLPAEKKSITTKSPESTSLQSYFDNLSVSQSDEPDQPVNKPIKRDPRRIYLLGAILLALLTLAGVWYVSSQPQNQVQDVNQSIPITIVLEPNACITARNTSVTDQPRWTVFLNDSLYSISNLYATRSFSLNNLASGMFTDFDGKTSVTHLRASVTVKDTTGGEQTTSVPLTRDTLQVRITCPVPATVVSNTTSTSATTSRLRVSVEYTNPTAANFGRIQAFMNSLEADTTYQFIRPLKPAIFTGRSQVRYFRSSDQPAAQALALRASRALGIPVGTQLTKDKRSPLTHLEVWVNNGVASQRFTCQTISTSWVNQFNGWQAGVNGYTYTLYVSGNMVTMNAESPINSTIGSSALGQGQLGSVESICRSNGVYLVNLASRIGRTLVFRSVGRTSCNLAIVDLNTNQLNGSQGQVYFNKLVQSASFSRYTPPNPSKSKAAKANPLQQTAPTGNDYNPNISQTNMAVQTPIQSATDNLRVESANTKDETLQNGINAYRRGQYVEAITLYDQFLANNPNNAYVLNLKGYSQFKLRQYDQAVTTLLSATKADPNYAWAYFDLARVYCAMGRSSEANQAREQAIGLRSDMQTIMQNDKEFMDLCGRGATAK